MSTPSSPRILIPIADGSEDMEFAAVYDVLVRAGATPVIASCNNNSNDLLRITCARGLVVEAHCSFSEAVGKSAPTSTHPVFKAIQEPRSVDSYAAIVFPGGMPGAATVGAHPHMKEVLNSFTSKSRLIAAMCASPVVNLAANKVFGETSSSSSSSGATRITCFPMMKQKLVETGAQAQFVDEPVVCSTLASSLLITSQGPGTALLFGLQIASHVIGQEAASKVAEGMLVKDHRHISSTA